MNTLTNPTPADDDVDTDYVHCEREGIDVAIYRSRRDGKLYVQIDTSEMQPTEDDPECSEVRVYYNDALAAHWEHDIP